MFKSRQASAPVSPVSPPSIEWVRTRAKHRLMGVSVLVLAGVLLFPMLFDTQPRPIPVDIPIEIPSRQSPPPLKTESTVAAAPGSVVNEATPQMAQGPAPHKGTVAEEEVMLPKAVATEANKPVPVAPPAASPIPPKAVAATEENAAKAVEPKAAIAPAPKSAPSNSSATVAAAEAARARALLEGKPVAKAAPVATEGRFIVQVGAFAETGRAQQVRQQLERAGLKTYTHVADTPEGKRIRVRLGPFSTRADAEKAAAKAKATGLPAAILTL